MGFWCVCVCVCFRKLSPIVDQLSTARTYPIYSVVCVLFVFFLRLINFHTFFFIFQIEWVVLTLWVLGLFYKLCTCNSRWSSCCLCDLFVPVIDFPAHVVLIGWYLHHIIDDHCLSCHFDILQFHFPCRNNWLNANICNCTNFQLFLFSFFLLFFFLSIYFCFH